MKPISIIRKPALDTASYKVPDILRPVCYVAEGVHIPCCFGCAVYGHRACSCEPVRP